MYKWEDTDEIPVAHYGSIRRAVVNTEVKIHLYIVGNANALTSQKEFCYMDLVRNLIVEQAAKILHTKYVSFYYVTN